RATAGAAPPGRVGPQRPPAPAPARAPPRPANVASTGPKSASRPSHVAAAAARPRPVPARGAPSGIHVVGPGQSLTSIGRLYGKSRQELAKANDIEPSAVVRVGQRLTIPGVRQADIKLASHAPAHEPAAPSAPVPHTKPPAAAAA